MTRKFINMLDSKSLDSLPFYLWECLTIQLEDRDLNFVIRDQHDMNHLLSFLIIELGTLDGERGSGNKLLDLMDL
jgi:hypothetical protein